MQSRERFGAAHDLREVRRTDLFLTFCNKYDVHGRFSPGALEGVQGGEKCSLRTFRVYIPASDQDLAKSGLVDQSSIPRRRGPLGRIHLLDVVHEVNAHSTRGTRIKCGEYARMTFSGDFVHRVESGVPKQAHHHVTA